ncbi:BC1881 family protein [Lysinibacillus fusiformis]|uniref:BC1881 family protein n=1 Tax=Lysinibacillus fusiformis TaxID=28031 RepID=UPI001967CD49|nr:BC1881 family protein [Lysinibacillus fusiformis]QSB09699.1 BC1881 family protein [Lysinibacillus fusiformis]
MKQKSIDMLPTKDLHESLASHERVSEIIIPPYKKFRVLQGQRVHEFTGPARLLINED